MITANLTLTLLRLFFFIPKTAFNEGKIKRFIKAVFWNESNMLVFANFRTA